MTRSLTTQRAALGLSLLVACGDSAMATPEVFAEATQNMLCVTAGGSSLTSVQASSEDLEPSLIFRDAEDGLTFNPPWSGSASGELDGLRCYSLLNLDRGNPYFHQETPDELLVEVVVGGASIDLVVPLGGSDLSLFGERLECTTVYETRYDDRGPRDDIAVRNTYGSVEAPPGTLFTVTACDEYVLRDGVKEVLRPGCRSSRGEMDESGEVERCCSQERTEADGRVVGPGRFYYVRLEE